MENGTTHQMEYSSTNASAVVNAAVGNLTGGGTIFVKAGTYPIGICTMIDSCDSGWSSADGNVAVSHDSGDKKEGTASVKIEIAEAFTTGLVAYKNFGSSQDLSSYVYNGLWFKSNITLTIVSDVQIQFDDSPNCASPEFSLFLSHPEQFGVDTWKYEKPCTGSGAYNLPLDLSSLTSVQSIGIKMVNDKGNCTLKVDQVDMYKDMPTILTDDIRITGEGKSTVFKAIDGWNSPLFYVTGDYFEIDNVFLDGNRDNQDTVDVGVGVYLYGSDYSIVRNAFANSTTGQIVYIRNAHNCSVHEVTAWNFENALVRLYNGNDNIITNNHGINALNDCSIYASGSSSRNVIANNEFVSSTACGILISPSGSDISEGNIITGNSILNMTSYGIFLQNSCPSSIVSNNHVAFGGSNGISVSPTSVGSTISNNIVHDNNGTGISVDSNCVVSGNTVYNNDVDDDNNADGIRVAGKNVTVTGNIVFDNQATPTQDHCIRLHEGSEYNLVVGNFLGEAQNRGIYVDGSHNFTITTNFIRNSPVGIRLDDTSSNGTISHNIFRDCDYAIDLTSTQYVWVIGNDLRFNADDVPNQGTNTIWTDNLDRLGGFHEADAPDV